MGKIYMLIFYFIPHIEEQKPQMLHSGAVEEEMADVIFFHHSMNIEVMLLFS